MTKDWLMPNKGIYIILTSPASKRSGAVVAREAAEEGEDTIERGRVQNGRFFAPIRETCRMPDSSPAAELRQIRFLLVVLVTLVAVDVAGPLAGVGVTAAVVFMLALDAY